MTVGRMFAAGLAPLCFAVLSWQAVSAQSTPDTKPAPPKKHRTKIKKVRTVTVKKAPAKKASSKRAVSKIQAMAVAPKKPPADIPEVTEAASVRRGCMEPGDFPRLASNLATDEAHLQSLLAGEGLVVKEGSPCVPYVAAMGGEGGVASVIFRLSAAKANEAAARELPTNELPILVVRKTADGATATPGVCYCLEPAHRVLAVSAGVLADSDSETMASLPANLRWELDTLVPQMLKRIALERTAGESAPPSPSFDDDASSNAAPNAVHTATDAEGASEATADAYKVRLVVERHTDSEPEYLRSIEIIDSANDKVLDGAWWLERQNGPGVFISMEGLAYERLLWQSPVAYLRKSRGVGPAVSTYKRRVTTPAANGTGPKKTVVKTFKVLRQHLGVDMLAPKGLDVHSVGDAKVAFAGRKNGFGNVVILDHGLGYTTYYAHLSKITHGFKAGTAVSRGDVIGLVGSTGHSTAPHVHFETRKDSRYIDPFDETRQLDFWLLSADDQERLAMQLLTSDPVAAADDRVEQRR